MRQRVHEPVRAGWMGSSTFTGGDRGVGCTAGQWEAQPDDKPAACRQKILSPVRRELHVEPDHQELEPEPEPELAEGLRAGSQSLVRGSYISRLRMSPPSYLVGHLPWSLPTSTTLPQLDRYLNLLPRSLYRTWDTWTILEVSAAYVGLNRCRRVRVARQLDKLETSFLVCAIPHCAV